MTRKNPYKPQRSLKDWLKFVVVAVVILFLVDRFLWNGERPYVKKIKEEYAQEVLQNELKHAPLPPPVEVKPEDGGDYFEAPPEMNEIPAPEPVEPIEPVPDKSSGVLPEKTLNVEIPSLAQEQNITRPVARIAIVIDDLGMNIKQSRAAMELPGPVTLALLPYAETIRSIALEASGKGHELIIHTPMEAMDSSVDLGGMALYGDMDFETFNSEFDRITESFDGYVGINNHMGSKLTQDPDAMAMLMDKLKEKNLYFLDSKTINTSLAAEVARVYGVAYAERDVFLDHEETPQFVEGALAKLERKALENGSAIAIGHPKEVTMEALRQWMPTLAAKHIELVAVSELLHRPEAVVMKTSDQP